MPNPYTCDIGTVRVAPHGVRNRRTAVHIHVNDVHRNEVDDVTQVMLPADPPTRSVIALPSNRKRVGQHPPRMGQDRPVPSLIPKRRRSLRVGGCVAVL